MKLPSTLTFHRYRPAAWLRITGADAATFLQGQFTQDLQNATTGAAVYGLWLTPKGKTVADSFILKGTAYDQFWILS